MKKIAFLCLLFAAITFIPQVLHAQSAGGSWFEDDEDEEVTMVEGDEEVWDVAAGRMDDVLIRVNGDETRISEEYNFDKKDTLTIQVRHLRPNSAVVLHMKKGGIKLKRTSYYSNEKGQLDLEVRTGNKKVSGTADIYYTPSNGKKKERKAKISIR